MTVVAPYTLPADFNPATSMVKKTTEYGLFHESRRAARLAAELVANGEPQDLALAEQILAQVLKCQERDPRDPHCGNFTWMREDDHVEDLNAVEFVLEALIPMLLRHADRLTPATRAQVLASIRLGLAEIERLDVLVAYTNITMLDILNTCLGGELLGDTRLAQRGYGKLAAWIEFTNRSGHPMEYNSPTYGAVTLRALKLLADLVQHQDTRQRALAMTARLALSVALHLHSGTGRWAGPHGRAYQPSVVCETPSEVEMLRGWIDDGTAPPWIADVLDNRPVAFTVIETADHDRELALSTYHTPAYALGVASSSFHGQANVCIAQFARPGADRPGVFYTRYVLDDKWFGDSYHATDRTKTRNLPDEGSFFGVQDQNRALCLYAPTGMVQCHSAKAVCIWTQRAAIDGIWIGDQPVAALPADVPPGQVVVVASGQALVAVRPLAITALGKDAPVTLVERDGDLVLEMANYRGPSRRFWELNWPGAFFKGRPFVAFYIELAERTDYADGAAFARAVLAGAATQHLDEPFTYPAAGERRCAVSYARGERTLGIEVDIMLWRLKRRWTADGDAGWPMLDSPMARQSASGRVSVGEARVESDYGPVWLFASPASRCWVAGYLGQQPTSLTLYTPGGVASVAAMGAGTVVWRKGQVDVSAVGAASE